MKISHTLYAPKAESIKKILLILYALESKYVF